jgi:3-hydroxyacyl-CoA dehydrogenase
MKVERVGVVGGGIMGSGIAALFANQKLPVFLFDVNPEVAAASIAKLTDPKQKLQQLTSARHAKRITPASTDDYAELLPQCDVIVEVVPEILSLKQKVFKGIDEHRKPGSVVSSNTSGLSINAMVEGCSEDMQAHFLGTHYFHPVRYMPLVELIPHARTKPEVMQAYAAFFEQIGKKAVVGRDTPNFIANRIGIFAVMKAIRLAEKYGLTVEEVDMVTGPPLGYPKTATFRLADMVGLDTLLHATTNSYENCPDDEVRAELEPAPLVKKLVEAGRLGLKTGEGFFKKVGKGKILTLDVDSFEYRAPIKARDDLVRVAKGYAKAADRVKVMVEGSGKIGNFARDLVLATGAYALNRLGEVADDVKTIDDAMRWGFSRELGPIQSLDAIGLVRAAELMKEAKIPVPEVLTNTIATTGSFYSETAEGRTQWIDGQGGWHTEAEDPSVISLPRLHKQGKIVRENLNARLVDLGDGVLGCEFAVKMVPDLNPLDEYVLAMMAQAHELILGGEFKALVIGNQAPNFCAGANLKGVLDLAEAGQFDRIEALAKSLQQINLANLHAPFPVVAAIHGMTLGGGLEIALGAQVRVCASELYCGLVEVGVGLIPAGGGCLRLLQLMSARKNKRGRPFGPMQNALAAFDLIGYGKVSTSAEDAMFNKGLIPVGDVLHANRDQLIAKAKQVALARLEGFEALPETPVALPGRGGYLVMEDTICGLERAASIPPHGAAIARVQARILSGGDANPTQPVSEERLCELEREGFVELCKQPLTRARMKHMLKTGKPLMN